MQDTAVLPGCCTATGHPSGFCKYNIPHLSEKKNQETEAPRELRYQPGVPLQPLPASLGTVSAAPLCKPRLSRTAAEVLLGSSWHYGKICVCHQINRQAYKSERGRIPRRPGHRPTATQLSCKVRIMLCFANPRRTDPLSSTVWQSVAGVCCLCREPWSSSILQAGFTASRGSCGLALHRIFPKFLALLS